MLETALWATFSDHLLHMSHRHTVYYVFSTYSFSSVQLLSSVLFFVSPWTAVCQAFLFVTNSRSLLKFTSKESVMPSNHLTLCSPPPSPPAFNLSQHHSLFKWVSSSNQVTKVLEFQLQSQSFQWIFRVDFL